ncbi:MAG: ATPase, T2SS/T4P/T4SS family [Conexivisphaerales archaeon]
MSILRPAKKKQKQRQEQGVVKGLLPTVEPTVKFGYVNEPIPETAEVIEKYWIKEPFSGVVIAKLPESGGSLEYFVQEITLTEQEQIILDKIIEIVSVEINPSSLEKQEDIKVALLEEAKRIMKKYVKKFPMLLDQHVREKINYYLERDLLGYGPIHTLMNDWRIEDISCDGVNSNIYIWHRRYESVPTSIKFTDRKALDDFIVKLAHKSGKHVSSAFPIVDAMIFGKHRLAASFREEISPKGSTFTIRKFREEPYSIIDLMNLNTVSDSIAAYLWLMMENRASILVIGGTAAGKTTILNAIAGLIKPGYKVVTVEETAEINVPTENWVQFTSRESYGLTGNKVGEVSLFDLVRTSLRYRPDFLIVGEVRGEEAFVLFQAVATGHGGLCIPPWERVVSTVDGSTNLSSIEDLYNSLKPNSSMLLTNSHEIIVPSVTVEVPTFDAEQNRIITAKIGGISRRRFNGNLMRFRTRDGNEATVTEDHPMLVLRGNIIQRVPAKKVKLSDLLLVPNNFRLNKSSYPMQIDLTKAIERTDVQKRSHLRSDKLTHKINSSIHVDRELCRLIGYYLARGRVSADAVVFSLDAKETSIIDEVSNAVERILGAKAEFKKDKSGKHTVLRVKDKAVRSFFTEVLKCGSNNYDKKVPDMLFNPPDELVRDALDAYFLGNGSAFRRADREVYISTVTRSKDLAYGIYYLMLGLGYHILLGREGKSDSVQLTVARGKSLEKFLTEFSLGRELYSLLEQGVSLSNARMPFVMTEATGSNTILSLHKSQREMSILENIHRGLAIDEENAVRYEEIVDIEPVPFSGDVYDFINVGESHNFMHGFGIISSNCTIHGESLDTAVKRLTSPPMNVAESYIPLMNVALMLERVVLPKTVAGVPFGRRVTNVWEIEDFAKYVSVFEWSPTEDIFYDYTRRSVMLHRFAYRTGRSFTDMLEEIERRKALLKYLQLNNIRQVKEVYKYITEYYVDREALFRRLGIKVETAAPPPTAEAPAEIQPQQMAEEPQQPLPPQPAPEISKMTALPTEPIKMLQSGSFQILSALFEAKGPVEEEVLMKSVGLEKAEFDSLLSMLIKVGHAVEEKKGEGVEQKSYVSITPDGTRAYSLISKNVSTDTGRRGGRSQRKP